MTTQTLLYRFLLRGGTADDLTTVNEVPLERELVVETDTGLFKIGDGVTSWNSLSYWAGGAGYLDFRVVSGSLLQYQTSPGGPWTDIVNIASLAPVQEAPIDSSLYVRRNGSWVLFTPPSSAVSKFPVTTGELFDDTQQPVFLTNPDNNTLIYVEI